MYTLNESFIEYTGKYFLRLKREYNASGPINDIYYRHSVEPCYAKGWFYSKGDSVNNRLLDIEFGCGEYGSKKAVEIIDKYDEEFFSK